MNVRLVQLRDASGGRRVAMVDGSDLRLLASYNSVYDLAQAALESGNSPADVAHRAVFADTLNYHEIHELRTGWRFLPSFDHPTEPGRCLVSGTGLTHLASAQNRQAMHAAAENVTDSMRMYLWGVEGGKPRAGSIGIAPEWFYKGSGAILRGHGEPLVIPAYSDDGGEEPEVAGAYVIDRSGQPRRVGLTTGNEFSDHRTEKKNYLYLAPSKLRNCAIGPELVAGASFDEIPGSVAIHRGGQVIWSKQITTGEANMSHTLANLEHHHFKFQEHRRPGDVHVHFFGADAFSFGAGIALEDGDVMEIVWTGLGLPLRNTLRIEARGVDRLVEVRPV